MFYFYSLSKDLFSLVTFAGFALSLLAMGSGVQAMRCIEPPSLDEVKRHLTSPQPAPGKNVPNTLTHVGNGQYTSVSRCPVPGGKNLFFELGFKVTAKASAAGTCPFPQKITVPAPNLSLPELIVIPTEPSTCPMHTLTISYSCSSPFKEEVEGLFPSRTEVSTARVVLSLPLFGNWRVVGGAFIEDPPPSASLGDQGPAPVDTLLKPEAERTQTPSGTQKEGGTQAGPKEGECCIS